MQSMTWTDCVTPSADKLWRVTVESFKSAVSLINRHDFLPKYTQIQLQIILFLLFWDVLWIINDLLAPLSLFFHEFQQNSQFLRTISNDPDLGRVAYNHEYTQIYIKISSFKSLIYIVYKLFFTFLQKFWYWKFFKDEVQKRNTDEEKDRSQCRSQCCLQQWHYPRNMWFNEADGYPYILY